MNFRAFFLILAGVQLGAQAHANEFLYDPSELQIAWSKKGRASIGVALDPESFFETYQGLLSRSRGSLTVGFDPARGDVGLDQAEVALVQTTLFKFLGVERDIPRGTPFSITLGGAYLPFALKGETHSTSFVILQIGGEAFYRFVRTENGASFDGKGVELRPEAQLNEHFTLGESQRVQLRAFQQISYGAFVGGRRDASGLELDHVIGLMARAGLYVDISDDAPFKRVKKTDRRSGKVQTYLRPSLGQRLRLKLVETEAEWNPVDQVREDSFRWVVRSGLEYGY